jgi:hypothetical protein
MTDTKVHGVASLDIRRNDGAIEGNTQERSYIFLQQAHYVMVCALVLRMVACAPTKSSLSLLPIHTHLQLLTGRNKKRIEQALTTFSTAVSKARCSCSARLSSFNFLRDSETLHKYQKVHMCRQVI